MRQIWWPWANLLVKEQNGFLIFIGGWVNMSNNQTRQRGRLQGWREAHGKQWSRSGNVPVRRGEGPPDQVRLEESWTESATGEGAWPNGRGASRSGLLLFCKGRMSSGPMQIDGWSWWDWTGAQKWPKSSYKCFMDKNKWIMLVYFHLAADSFVLTPTLLHLLLNVSYVIFLLSTDLHLLV